MQTPQAGGHWIAILPMETVGLAANQAQAAILCDSLEKKPYQLSHPELEDLLTSCAIANTEDRRVNANAINPQWASFLVTDTGI